MKICFICTGNTCRSPMAEGLLKKLVVQKYGQDKAEDFEIISAGVRAWPGQPASEQAIEVMNKEYDIDLKSHRSRLINPELIQQADLLIAMTGAHKEFLNWLFPEATEKIKTLAEVSEGEAYEDIDDPFGGSYSSYSVTAEQIAQKLQIFIDNMEKFI